MSHLANAANCVINYYPDAHARAVCQNGLTAIYFVHGMRHGTRMLMSCYAGVNRRLIIDDEAYRLKIFRERTSPMYKYPFYVYQKPRRERA